MITKELQNMKPLGADEQIPRDSEYLGADDLDDKVEPVLTIKSVYRGKVTLSRGKETKNVIVFAEEKVPGIIGDVRPMILNATNRQTLKKLFKQVTAGALMGKQIQLYIEHNVRNPSNGEMTDGIRIRDKKPTGGKATKAPACSVCGKEIVGVSGLSAEQVAKMTKDKYGKQMCSDCAAKKKAEMEANAKAADEAKAAMDNETQVHPDSDNDLAAQLMAEVGE